MKKEKENFKVEFTASMKSILLEEYLVNEQ